jgi:hypothetical protein
MALGLEFFFDLAPPVRGGLEAGSRIAVGWFACGRAGRDAVECVAFGVAELVGDLAERR